jgi:hypothetical protein
MVGRPLRLCCAYALGRPAAVSLIIVTLFPEKVASQRDSIRPMDSQVEWKTSQTNSQVKPAAPLSDPGADLRKSHSGAQKENMPPLRASMSSIEHFHIPEYSEDDTDNQKTEVVVKEERSAARSALPHLPEGGAQSAHDNVRYNAFSPSQMLEQIEPSSQRPPTSADFDELQTRNDVMLTDSTGSSRCIPEQREDALMRSNAAASVESYQRHQELAMQASFGASGGSMPGTGTGTLSGSSGTGPHRQGGTRPRYGMEAAQQQGAQNQMQYHQTPSSSTDQMYVSGPYRQQHNQQMWHPHQAYDLYSSQGSMPQQAHEMYSSQNSMPMSSQGMMPTGLNLVKYAPCKA